MSPERLIAGIVAISIYVCALILFPVCINVQVINVVLLRKNVNGSYERVFVFAVWT